MNYQLSIVIPVFNSEQYLPRLFKSLGEVPPEVEIILVNNGSTDNSARLLQHYHETHADTVIIDENRRGVAFARNAGLDNSNGKYVWFIDADDVLLLVQSIAFYGLSRAPALICSSLIISHWSKKIRFQKRRQQ
nr:glycosyltransferase [Lacticaseibacillus rhamnosus]